MNREQQFRRGLVNSYLTKVAASLLKQAEGEGGTETKEKPKADAKPEAKPEAKAEPKAQPQATPPGRTQRGMDAVRKGMGAAGQAVQMGLGHVGNAAEHVGRGMGMGTALGSYGLGTAGQMAGQAVGGRVGQAVSRGAGHLGLAGIDAGRAMTNNPKTTAGVTVGSMALLGLLRRALRGGGAAAPAAPPPSAASGLMGMAQKYKKPLMIGGAGLGGLLLMNQLFGNKQAALGGQSREIFLQGALANRS